MKDVLIAAFLSLAVLFAGAALVGLSREAPDPGEAAEKPSGGLWYESPSFPADSGVTVRLLEGEQLRETDMERYLVGALAAEMPASFEPEALRAQAVALRTYVLRKMVLEPSARHPEADICADPTCCAAWRSLGDLRVDWGEDYGENLARIRDAVRDTDGEVLTYAGEPALAVFHASSDGYTEDAAAVWGQSLPYLVSVESPEREDSVPGFTTTVTVAAEDFREAILGRWPEADLSGSPETWLTDPAFSPGGRLESLSVGGVRVQGTALRSLFALRSTALTVEVDGDAVTFTARGSGHGVGMSQYGANQMARDGAGYEEILAAYYPGTTLVGA